MVRGLAAAVAVPGVLAAAILAANHYGRSSAARVVAQVPAAPAAPVTVRLDVQSTTVRAGQPIRVTVYAFNHTRGILTLADCPSGVWPVLVLGRAGEPDRVFAPHLPCAGTALPRGISQFRISVPTPVPPGAYQLRIGPGGVPAGSSLPAPVTITLR